MCPNRSQIPKRLDQFTVDGGVHSDNKIPAGFLCGPHPPPPLCEATAMNETEAVFLNVYGAQESVPRNEFRQPM